LETLARRQQGAGQALAFEKLTPERWAAAAEVLLGDNPSEVSLKAAARAAGVTLVSLKLWGKRSAERWPEDDEWIHEIAIVMTAAEEMQAATLEDVLWDRALNGWDEPVFHGGEQVGTRKKHDHKLMLKMLAVRDERYRTTRPADVTNNILNMTPEEVRQRMVASGRWREIEGERGKA